MEPELWYNLTLQRNQELLAQANSERLAKSVITAPGPARAALLLLANGLISSGQTLKSIAQRREHGGYQTSSPCQ